MPMKTMCFQASYLALKWLDPLVNRGYERQVNLQDSPQLADQEDTARNTWPGRLVAKMTRCICPLVGDHLGWLPKLTNIISYIFEYYMLKYVEMC